jgi:hypothetical protein
MAYLIWTENEDEYHIGGKVCWCGQLHEESASFVYFEIKGKLVGERKYL